MITINNKFRNTNSNTINLNANDKDSDRVSRKDLHEKFWESRSFEINHLWQRSIFLATFIVALFTLYFGVLNSYYTEGDNNDSDLIIKSIQTTELDDYYKMTFYYDENKNNEKTEYRKQYFAILEGICFFGFQFSVLWICMARGSKYMYERHENGIEEAYRKGSFDEKLDLEVSKEFYEILWESGDYTYIPRHGALPLSDYDYRAMHLEGGKFSSSKINIIIGYIFSSAWVTLTFISSILLCGFDRLLGWGFVAFFLELFCALYTSYRVLSDNNMKFGDFCSLVRQTFHQGKSNDRNLSSDENQETWVMKAKVDPDNVYIFEHVDNILRQYQKICDNPLQRYILHEYFVDVKEKGSGDTQGSNTRNNKEDIVVFRWLQSNEYLWQLYSTALMYRESFSKVFQSLWVNPRNVNDFIMIYHHIIHIHLGKIDKYCFLHKKNVMTPNVIEETRLFADTDWWRIRSGNPEYDLIEGARRQHLIWKEINGDTLYMTMDISPSISDREFYYHHLDDDIDNKNLIRMTVTLIYKGEKVSGCLFRDTSGRYYPDI